MLQYVKGDLIAMAFDGQFDVIVHGCNCFNTMGSGIAKQIRERCEPAWIADQQTHWGDYGKLGNYTYGLIPVENKGFVVINAYTQYEFNKGSERADLFEYTSFQLILQKLLHDFSDVKIGFPMIGMGLAGGDKTRIIGMIEDFTIKAAEKNCQTSLVEFG